MKQKVDMLERNVSMNLNVVRCCHRFGVKRLIACLSTCIFPDQTTYPINETMLHGGPPHHSNDAYAYSKRLLETQCKAYREQYGDDFVCVIPTNIYGIHDNFSLQDGHVIPALVHRCYLAKQNQEDFIVAGTGQPLRQFIYSLDLARLIVWVLEKYTGEESIILAPSEAEEVSIGRVAELIAKQFDYQSRLKFDHSQSDGQFRKTASNARLVSQYGDLRLTSIEDGIQQTVTWFIENYETCRK